jgi:hypothetical protein
MEKKMQKGRTTLCIWKPTSAFGCLWIQGLQQNTFIWHISINNPINWYIHFEKNKIPKRTWDNANT